MRISLLSVKEEEKLFSPKKIKP